MNVFLRYPFVYLVRREMISAMRRGRVFMLVAAVTAASIGLTIYSWPSQDMLFSTAGMYSTYFTQLALQGVILTSMLLLPAFAAGAITAERRQETAELLQLTLIEPSGVILAKLASSVGLFIFIVIAVTPVFGVLFFLVGIDWRTLGTSLMVALVSAITCGLIGLYTSAAGRRGAHVVAYSYIRTFFLMVFVPTLLGLTVALPWVVLARRPGGILFPMMAVAPVIYQTLLSVALFAGAVRAWKRPPRPAKGEQDKSIEDIAILRQRRWSYPFYIVDPLKRKKPIPDGLNPMMVKDIQWGLSGHGSTWARWFAYGLLASFLISMGTILDSRDPKAVVIVLWFQLAMMALISPGLLANSFTKELESGGLDMLRITLLRPTELVVGKFLGGAVFLAPMVFSWIVMSLIISAFNGAVFFHIQVVGYATIILCCALCLSSSLLASLVARRTGPAAALSYLFAFVFFVGASWVADALSSQNYMFYEGPTGLSNVLSPVYAFAGYAEHSRRLPGSESLVAWFEMAALYSALCVVLLWCGVVVYKRMHLRDV